MVLSTSIVEIKDIHNFASLLIELLAEHFFLFQMVSESVELAPQIIDEINFTAENSVQIYNILINVRGRLVNLVQKQSFLRKGGGE